MLFLHGSTAQALLLRCKDIRQQNKPLAIKDQQLAKQLLSACSSASFLCGSVDLLGHSHWLCYLLSRFESNYPPLLEGISIIENKTQSSTRFQLFLVVKFCALDPSETPLERAPSHCALIRSLQCIYDVLIPPSSLSDREDKTRLAEMKRRWRT